MRSSTIMLGAGLFAISLSAQAKLSSAANAAIGHLTQVIFVFFGIALLFAVVGLFAERRFARRSRDLRQAIFRVSMVAGLLVAGFIATRLLA